MAVKSWGRYETTLLSAFPISAGLLQVMTPERSSARNLSSALPELPEIMAPAWPILFPLGAVAPAYVFGRIFCVSTLDFPYHYHRVCVGIVLKERERVDKRGSDNGVAAYAYARRLSYAETGKPPDGFAGERSAS